MKTIRQELQDSEDEQDGGYQLKTDDEIVDMICRFGHGYLEFHTVDINRLIVENERMKKKLGITEI